MENKEPRRLPIAVFDSGMGGLTVLKALKAALPNESYLYFGDTARLPYGTKSAATIVHYTTKITELLLQHGIKMLVIACNTATTAALKDLRYLFPELPIMGVIRPSAEAAIAQCNNDCIAVLATETTIQMSAYQNLLTNLNPKLNIFAQSCSVFVSLAEEGWLDNEATASCIKQYLHPLINYSIKPDCLILGCTHFPVLEAALQRQLPETIQIINSGMATAAAVKKTLSTLSLLNQQDTIETQYYITDSPQRFIKVGEFFLGNSISTESVHLVDLHHIVNNTKKSV